MNEEPNGYYVVITTEILFSKELLDSEKLLLAAISSLQKQTGWCYATNKYLAELTGSSPKTISNRISKLVNLGFLDRKIIYKDNSKEIKARLLAINFNKNTDFDNDKNIPEDEDKSINFFPEVSTQELTPLNPQMDTTIHPQVEDNINIYNNNINKEEKKINKKKEENSSNSNEKSKFIKDFLSYLYSLDKNLSKSEMKYISVIRNLIDSYSLEEVRNVLRFMTKDNFWMDKLFDPNSISRNFAKIRQAYLKEKEKSKSSSSGSKIYLGT